MEKVVQKRKDKESVKLREYLHYHQRILRTVECAEELYDVLCRWWKNDMKNSMRLEEWTNAVVRTNTL